MFPSIFFRPSFPSTPVSTDVLLSSLPECISPNCHTGRGQSYAGEKEKKKDTLELLSKTKTAGFCSQKSIAHAQASGCLGRKLSIQKWCLFVCERVSWQVRGWWGGGGGTLSFIAALSLAESLQSLNRSPSWAPTTNIAASPPLPRSSPPCAGSVLTSFA